MQKVDIENELEDLKIARENDKRTHKEKLHEVEREVLKEKDKLLREKDQQVKEIRENLLNLSKTHLHKATRLTIMENDQITTELAYQAKETMETMEQNKRLIAENSEMKRKVEVMSQLEKDFSKKNTAYQKQIKSLQTKLQAMESEVIDQSQQFTKEIENLRTEISTRDLKIKELEHVSAELATTQEARDSLQELLLISRRETEEVKHDVHEISTASAAGFENLKRFCLELLMKTEEDVREGKGLNYYDFSVSIESACVAEKEKVLEFISEKVISHARVGETPHSHSSIKRPTFPPIGRTPAKTPDYRIISPRPQSFDNTGKTYMGFAAPLTPIQQVKRQTKKESPQPTPNGTESKPEMVSVGIQTDSAEKTIFLLEKWMRENKIESIDTSSNGYSIKTKSPTQLRADLRKRSPVRFINN